MNITFVKIFFLIEGVDYDNYLMLCEKNIITQMILLLVNPIAFKCIFHDISQRFGPKMAVLFLYTCLNANGLRRSLGGCLKS